MKPPKFVDCPVCHVSMTRAWPPASATLPEVRVTIWRCPHCKGELLFTAPVEKGKKK